MIHPTIEQQLQIAQRCAVTGYACKLVEHPEDSQKKALEIDSFTIWACDIDPLDIGPHPRAKVSGFHVDVARQIPATRETPPDVDVSDVGDFPTFFKALEKVMTMIVEDLISNEAQSFQMDQMYLDEEKAEKEAEQS